MDGLAAWPGSLEIRQEGGLRVMIGVFPYGTLATLDNHGVVRKETFLPLAMGFSIADAYAPD